MGNGKKDLLHYHGVHPWRHKADWETPPRSTRTPHCMAPPGPPVLVLWGGLYIASVSSQKIIAQQVVGNNVHELTKDGSSCEV
jgi:hypothetical protein